MAEIKRKPADVLKPGDLVCLTDWSASVYSHVDDPLGLVMERKKRHLPRRVLRERPRGSATAEDFYFLVMWLGSGNKYTHTINELELVSYD